MASRKESINILVTDESIGVFQNGGKNQPALSKVIELEKLVIDNGYIKEPEVFLMLLKSFFKENKIKARRLNMIIHDQNILIREFVIQKSELQKKTIVDYIHSQTGRTLHFPFEEANISYVVKSETESEIKVIGIITDENLLQDYHDVFDRLGIKSVNFSIPANVLYQLSKISESKPKSNLMLVSVFDRMLTINVMEDEIPVFSMIEETEENLEKYDEMIENYIERVANYYKFNIKKGEESIETVVLFNFSREINDDHLKKHIQPEIQDMSFSVFDKKRILESIGGEHDVCIMAYGEQFVAGSSDVHDFKFNIERVKIINRYANYLLVLAFTIFSLTTLIYIPLYTFNEDINIQTNKNNILQSQIDVLKDDIPNITDYTQTEKNYSDAYDFISGQINNPSDYYHDLLSQLSGSLEVVRYTLDASTHEIKIIISSTTEVELYEYLIVIYEAYGITDGTDPSKWMANQPERKFVSSLVMEVTVTYA